MLFEINNYDIQSHLSKPKILGMRLNYFVRNGQVFRIYRLNSQKCPTLELQISLLYTGFRFSQGLRLVYFTEFGAAFDNCFTCFVQVLL